MAKVILPIFLWIPSSYSQRHFKIKPVTLTWALSQQGPDENGLRLASFTGCGPRWGRGGRYEWLETSLGLHEEEALREDWGLQGPGAELADEGQGNFSSHPCTGVNQEPEDVSCVSSALRSQRLFFLLSQLIATCIAAFSCSYIWWDC